MTSFIVWIVFFLLVVAALVVHTRRTRHIDLRSEDIAAHALPQIGSIATRQHTLRFGRPPTNLPGPPDDMTSWYPDPARKKRQTHV